MISQIKNKIKMAGLAAPAFAAVVAPQVDLTPKAGNFSQLTSVSVPAMLSAFITLILIFVGIVFFFMLVIGGIKWITSGGDEKKVAAARSSITNALIGLVVIFAAYAIIQLIQYFFGITIIGAISLPSFISAP